MLIDIAECHCHGNQFLFGRKNPVIQNDHPDAIVAYGGNNFFSELFESVLQILCKPGIKGLMFIAGLITGEFRISKREQRLKNIVGKNGRNTFQPFGAIFGFKQGVVDATKTDCCRHHRFFTQWINRWIGDLGKFLLEKIGKIPLLI